MKKKLTTLFLSFAIFCILCLSTETPTLAYTNTTDSNVASNNLNKITCYNDLTEACALGGTYILSDSITLTNTITIPSGVSLTLLQEPGKNHIISSNMLDALFHVKPNATLILGSTFSNPVILDGSNLAAYGSVVFSSGSLYIKNATITSPNGRGIVCDTIIFENGQIYNCKYEGIRIQSSGTILGGSFSKCMYGIFAYPESTVAIQNGTYTSNQTAVYSKGTCTISGGSFSKCEYTLQSSSHGSISFSGGTISDAGCWALDVSDGGSISFIGGEIRNSRSTTYPTQGQDIQGNLYVGGSPYMDETSFIYCRTGSPVIQIDTLTPPSNHPDAKMQIAAYSKDTPAVVTISNELQMTEQKDWYTPYDNSYDFVVTDNKLYARGFISHYNGQLPTVRPYTSTSTPELSNMQETSPVVSVFPDTTAPAKENSPSQTIPPVSSNTLNNSTPAMTITPSKSPSAQVENSLPIFDYSSFVLTAPTIEKVTSKGLSFHLTWNFDCILSPDNYAIYYSTNRKHFTLQKTVKGSKTTAALSIPKSYKGKRIYFRIVATISSEGAIYQSRNSNLVSKYLVPKVTGTFFSYHTNVEKLKVTWHKITNCTGYNIYLKATCNGTTFQKKCATVSNPQHTVSISSNKIKRLFSKKGKPVHIKSCYVQAYYKSGNKIAYSP